jgi:hypothetical protein
MVACDCATGIITNKDIKTSNTMHFAIQVTFFITINNKKHDPQSQPWSIKIWKFYAPMTLKPCLHPTAKSSR